MLSGQVANTKEKMVTVTSLKQEMTKIKAVGMQKHGRVSNELEKMLSTGILLEIGCCD